MKGNSDAYKKIPVPDKRNAVETNNIADNPSTFAAWAIGFVH